jgi:APA family basic amino acid/polyamine antiporter
LQAGLASLLVLLGTFNQILSYFIFVTVLFVALTVAALFVLRRRTSAHPAFGAPGYPVTPVIFLVLVAVLLLLLVGHDPAQALLGVAIVALGLPVYVLAFRRRFSPPLDDTT